MAKVTASSFDTLRTWNGEQSRAFEEFSFQLLKDKVPSGTRAIRTGNPDGGVEWYATLSDGTEHGWQAKHVHGIDALLTAMANSVKRVAKERSNLRKLTFVISWNLATSKAGKGGAERKSQRQKYEDKINAWQRTIPGADKIEFDLVQESDLLDELAKPEHNGRRWFWWGDLVFGHDWLVTRYDQQAAAASEKYRPDLQVDVPIQEDLLALGFDQSVLTIFNRLLRDVISAIADVHIWAKDEDATAVALYQAIQDAATVLNATAGALTLQAGDSPAVLDPLLAEVEACRKAIYAAEEHERKVEAEWRKLPNDDPKKVNKPSERTSGYGVRGLASAMDELIYWLESSTGRSLLRRAYFLTGQAGSGKTHLLLDATRRALDAGRPAVFLAGAQFGQGNLWASIADQLGLEAVGADVLLRAMDAAGEAASTTGSRFVIFIDALNETTPPDFWRVHLPTLRAAIAPYPHVALVVSCRDTYQDLVLEGAEGSHYIRRTHPGFAEREIEATQRYFAHYKLEAPKLPLLTPEFTLPLFLRLYCESLSQAETGPLPDGHQGRVAIFERYLTAKIATVARRFRPTASSSYELNAAKSHVSRVLDGLLDELSRLGRESMSTDAAEAVARASLGDASADATRVLGLLQDEGVLTRERLYLGSGNFDEGVRIVFQAFADFLLLKRRLALSDDPLNDQAVKTWLAEECSWGINEAATILFPEVYGVEVPDLLGIKLGAEPKQHEDQDAWGRHHRARQLYRSLVETLPYRDSRAISQRTIDLLNDAQRYLLRDEFYRVLFMLAPQPGNRLNGDRLHRYLIRQRMPQRDSDFGFATYYELFETFSPAARLARWAAGGPYPAYDAEVIELACIPLCWLLSSPNRFMRDWVTKALVQLLRGHLDVMRALFERFWNVDDPYVIQRVVAIAYGAILRSTPAEANQAKVLAEAIHMRVFTRPVRADELLLDAARGIVRWAVAHRLLPDTALDLSQRPYGLKPPGPPPTEATIEAKYGWHKDQPDDESYSSITFSLLSMGDFGRYVVEAGLHHFSRYRIGQEYPKREYRKPRFFKSRWEKFVASLSGDQKDALSDWLCNPEQRSMSRLDFLLRREDDPLSDEQHELLDAVFVYPKVVNDEYPADGARRWIFRRTLSLGWTPKLFGHRDRSIGHGRMGRESHKVERWGKKYQWMAYHELLARVADNYQASRRFDDSGPYEGLHQIIGDREIDPSLPPIDFRAFSENDGNGATAWDPPLIQLEEWPPARLDFSRYQGDIKRFLADTESEPTIASSTFVRDRDGNDWVVLESFVKKVDPLAHKGWRGLREQNAIDTLLLTADDAQRFLAALPDEPRHEIRDLLDSHGHTDCCYVGEVGRVGPTCYHRHDKFRQAGVGGKSFRVVATVEQYAWEGNILDCSIGETASTVLPSTFIQQAAELTFDMRGPSWLDAEGAPVFTYYEERGNDSRALLVRASFLREFLAEHKLELIVLHGFERMRLSDDHSGKHPFVESSVNARLTAELVLHLGKPRRTTRDLA
ncbi:hypothetical protein [Actinomadura chokoriensis]|uniref:ATP-binding protein n=1 Tax=Actinomadura chokoriensis TaxID=454156 RepID=A0ABV4QTT2_9ACTN